MTEWAPLSMFLYLDPQSHIVIRDGDIVRDESDAGESGTIASIDFVYDGKDRPGAVVLHITNDRAQAERWRSVFAAGGVPDLNADPPIVYDKYPRDVAAAFFERSFSTAADAALLPAGAAWGFAVQ